MMGFFGGAPPVPPGEPAKPAPQQTRRDRAPPRARQGDRVLFGRFRGIVDVVNRASGTMQVRVDLGGGKVGTQVLGWPAPTLACPRQWDLCPESPPRAGESLDDSRGGGSERAPAQHSASRARRESPRDPRLGSRGPPPALPSIGMYAARPTPPRPGSPASPPPGGSSSGRGSAGQHRQEQQVRRSSAGGESTEGREAHKASRKRSRSAQSGADAMDVAAMQHKCSKYRTKLNAASPGANGSSGGGEVLTPQKRKDYEEKLQHWENKLRKLAGKDRHRDRNRDRDRSRG